ncbi:MAG: tryptophan 2,3-dioxygenase [Planctomycetota bacterium]|nr:MAG: tryptophan 2,3-dioxygenase [Planctomycetota bacterium]
MGYGSEGSEPIRYSEYLRVPELLDQQHCLTVPEAHDELQFIIVHQVYELWFKLVRHELDAILAALKVGGSSEIYTATRLSRRVQEIFKVLVKQIHVLESMRPSDFMAFRKKLNPASGFQSVQFREVEAMLGLKDATLAAFTREDPRHPALLKRLEAESIDEVAYELLRQRGFDVVTPSAERSEADEERSLLALKVLYDKPDNDPALYELLEGLVELDEQLILWRRHHVMMVERQIGDKPGTGKGTTGNLDGIRYLRTTLNRRAFPDLWAVRTVLSD